MSERQVPVNENEDEELFERILESGQEVAYQDWDSGGPGAGAGRVSVYEYESKFYVFHDAGMDGPYETKTVAVSRSGIDRVNEASRVIWDVERGRIYPIGDNL